ncbi:MAG: hypothetical protein U9Q73_00435 [Nanoarchaeota archaeon]|nr:hypothetical protein [Nanoarchaeota archaeon]
MVIMSWVDVKERSPVDISLLISHSQKFNSLVGIKISSANLDNAKKSLIEAKREINLMFISIKHFLSDITILKNETDKIYYGWLDDNIGRYLKKLDEDEQNSLIKFDQLESDITRVGVSRVSFYANSLKLAHAIIHESFCSSITEYENLQEGERITFPKRKGVTNYVAVAYDSIKKKVIKEKGKPLIIKKDNKPMIVSLVEHFPEEIAIIEKNRRTFMYIFFQKLQSAMSTIGGLAREGKSAGFKKGSIGNYPTTWQSLMTSKGQKEIAKKHEETTGEKIEIDESMIDNSPSQESEVDENTVYFEEIEEDKND